MSLDFLREADPEVADALQNEAIRENEQIVLIASENYVSENVLSVQGSIMTNKYAEGYPGKRYYGGCDYVDRVEDLARERAKEIFGAEHANVQPHSGTSANLAVYLTVLKPGDRILGMSLAHGGHLSHGAAVNVSGQLYEPFTYGVSRETGRIDYDELRQIARSFKPKMIVAGASAYSRTIDFEKFREIADEVGAYLMADIAHIAGLIAAGLHPNPAPYADFVTSTTHKTLRGPRGGLILCKERYAKSIDRMIFPGLQGGPLMHIIAAKAVAFKEAMTPAFKEYQAQIIRNAKAMASEFTEKGYRIVSGGTDNHLMLVDLSGNGMTGDRAEKVLDRTGISLNKNVIPFDTAPPAVTSGIRVGAPIITTRGMKENEARQIVGFIDRVLKNMDHEKVLKEVHEDVRQLCKKFPVYSGRLN
ncbi:MAG: serine hydroxymethyltransferase [Nitrospirae bacterium CG_4_9_14_3_um_filter_53_35]|nr:MAG: serine hydroxymethyltransferase [Nitrospirae bacterium CG2_30_53_67]PIS36420.1 MAG: serine hydroxymethyltransferase [Nitrospirae bacterium CG08_land_8_20_14_0_20_52_24]PIV85546.1 MAG: serine hydroxymethyltransferase [Nitrospirae bacterium CG17_big_fil_post_rev_8_21_14_2_50_50_9]PIW84181.1 MAG: serine hydroxymethyltransferase [Nitrospirae bacterium CG_4_8_14_3_um_filter_50_41]PIX84498.1 MAG: serine hydroxymethyltransferase [Nitrospirae bacterium CG_4_10_14_3_um_filter_53_41]PJA74636.1 M